MYDVIVVGAGFAGLRAARDLKAAGKSVLVLEARDRIGGRTHYGELSPLDQKVEFGGTWVMPKFQPFVAGEIERYGLELTASPTPEHYRWHFAGGTTIGGFPVPFAEIPQLEHAMARIIQESHRISFGQPLEEQGLEDLDIPFSAWLKENDISGTPLEIINSYGAALCFGVGPDDLSALHAISWVSGCGNSPWELFNGPTIKFAHGTSSFYNKLAEGIDVRLATPVTAIRQEAHSVAVEVEGGEVLQARVGVVAVPLNTWKNIEFLPALSPAKAKFTQDELAGRDVKLWAQVRGVPRYAASLGWETPLQWLSTEFEREDGSIMVGFGYDESEIDPLDRVSVERAIHHYYPEAEVLQWWSEDWNSDPYSLGTWTAFRPGQITHLAAPSRKPEGRLIFATADVAVGFSGWIEGALESGSRAAEQAIELAT